jgi:hypothetical protein
MLKVNYRTSHQIRTQADRLLDGKVSDVDGNLEDRSGTVSLFDGPLPQTINVETEELEQSEVAKWLQKRLAAGLRPDEMVDVAGFVRGGVAAHWVFPPF